MSRKSKMTANNSDGSNGKAMSKGGRMSFGKRMAALRGKKRGKRGKKY